MRGGIARAYEARSILAVLAVAGVYLVAARAGMALALFHKSVSPVWPAAGVALAALVGLGLSRWPGILLGSFLAALLSEVPWAAGLGISVGNTLEAVLGALLLRRLGFSAALERVQDVLALVLGAAVGCSLVSAGVGVASLGLAGLLPWAEAPRAAWVWWCADTMGAVVVAPVLLLVGQWRPVERRLEAAALALATLLVCLEVFFGGLLGPDSSYVEAFLFFPLTVWAALRFGTRGAAFTAALITALSLWGTVQELGPFAGALRPRALLLVQLFIAINAITGLLLAAVSAERRKALQRLELLDTVVRGVSEGVVISEVAPGGPRIVFANEAFGALVGQRPEALRGRCAREQTGELDPETHERLEAALREARSFRGQVLLQHPEGRQVHSELHLSPARDGKGRATHLVSIYRDVTTTQELRARLLAAERVAALGLLAAGVGHEINNPLAYLELCLGGAVRGLGRGGAGLAEALVNLHGAQEGAERIRRIVQDLGLFSRNEGEARERVDLREVVAPALRMTRHLLRERARLVEDYEPVPPVLGSQGRLGQVLLNLLVNALQAIPEGAPERHQVRVATRTAADGRAQVEVSDTGQGICPEVLPHIFEPFFTTKRSGEGTGLGLALCRQILQAHGGELRVRSQPGQGATFTMLLPAAPEAGPEPVRPPRPQPEDRAARRGRILIIDDEPRLAQSMRLLLESSHEVVTTTCGNEALALVSAGQRFDVVVCDLQMPETTGMEVYARLRQQAPALAERLVFISGGACTPAARDFIRTVPNRVLEKPVPPEVLLATIDAALAPPARPGLGP